MRFIHLRVSGNVYTGTVDGKLWRIGPDDRLTFITQMGQNLAECGWCYVCLCPLSLTVTISTCFLNSARVLRQQHRFWARVRSSARRSPGPPRSADRRGLVLRAAQRRPSNRREDGPGVQLSGWRVWGMLWFHSSSGHLTPGLSSGAAGVPFAFLNGLEVSSQTGMIYFTDSSSRWGRRHVKLEVTCLFFFKQLQIYSGNGW